MVKKFELNIKDYFCDFPGYKYSISFIGNPSELKNLNLLCAVFKAFQKKLHIFASKKDIEKSLNLISKNCLLDENETVIFSKCFTEINTETFSYCELFTSSKINILIDNKTKPTVDIKIFEVLASGGFLLTNERNLLEKYFSISRHLETFSDTFDLIDKIDFYLKNMNIAQSIAQLGRIEVIKKFAIKKNNKILL